jgi:DNA-binding NarL/FixJ family response regulator
MFDRQKVLIIDQSPIFRRTLREVIEKSENHVDVIDTGNPSQAKRILREKSPDVVFLDIALSQNHGIEFIEYVKDLVPGSRVVVLTSQDSVEYKEASLKNGADYFLSKERAGGLRLLDVIHVTIRR